MPRPFNSMAALDSASQPSISRIQLPVRWHDTVLVTEIFLGIDGILFLHDLEETFVTHDNGIHNHVVIVFEMILFQHGETLTGGDDDITFGSVQLTGQKSLKRWIYRHRWLR